MDFKTSSRAGSGGTCAGSGEGSAAITDSAAAVLGRFAGREIRPGSGPVSYMRGVVRCHNGAVKGLKCKGTHYSKVGPSPYNFYSTTLLLKGAPPDDKKPS